MWIISWCWIRHTSWTSGINMTKIMRQQLHLIISEAIIVMKNIIMTRSTSALLIQFWLEVKILVFFNYFMIYLNTSMRAQEIIKHILCYNSMVNYSSRWYIHSSAILLKIKRLKNLNFFKQFKNLQHLVN